MASLEFNYQVGIPTTTFPTSLTVTSSAAGVSINSFAPTHKYVAFGLVGAPTPPPAPTHLVWSPEDQGITIWLPLVFTGPESYMTGYTYEQFQAVDPTTVGYIYFSTLTPPIPGAVASKITALSNFTPYTNLTVIAIQEGFLSEIDFQNITLVPNVTYPISPRIEASGTESLSSVTNLALSCLDFNLYDNSFTSTVTDNILIELDNNGEINGELNLGGYYMNPRTSASDTAYNNLISKGWSISVNEALYNLYTSSNASTTMTYIYDGVTYTNTSVDAFQAMVDDGIKADKVSRMDFSTGVYSYIDNLQTYKNVTRLLINDTVISSLNIRAMCGLAELYCQNNTSLTSVNLSVYYKNLTYVNFYNCALDQLSVDDILVSCDNNGKLNGYVRLDGIGNAGPSATGLTAITNLEAKGWQVIYNAF